MNGMKISIRETILGIEFSLGDNGSDKPLEPSPNANQEKPRKNYVYAHIDQKEQIFYIGKGTGRRAWSDDRHDLWTTYVQKHLNGNYRVQILQDNLSPAEAERLEANWMAQFGDTLVNWVHTGRSTDFKALENYHSLRKENRNTIAEAKALEKIDIEAAVAKYVQAIEKIGSYAFMTFEKGLIGKLLEEEAEEFGRSGEIEAIDRLTMCLCKLGRKEEAVERAEKYFEMYQLDLGYARIPKMEARLGKTFVRTKPPHLLHPT